MNAFKGLITTFVIEGMYSDTRSLVANDVMSFPVVTGKEKDNIRSIATKMKKFDISAVVITDKDNKPIGMVTAGDIVLRLVSKKRNLLFVKAKDAMTKPAITMVKETPIDAAAKLMVDKKVKKLCVVDDKGAVTGIVTEGDIVKNASYLIDVLKAMIDTGYVKEIGMEL